MWAAKSHTDPATYCQLFTHTLPPTAATASQKQLAESSSLLWSWCMVYRCRTFHLPCIPPARGSPAWPPTSWCHHASPIAGKWVFSLPWDSFTLHTLGSPRSCGFHPRNKSFFLGNLEIKISVTAALSFQSFVHYYSPHL